MKKNRTRENYVIHPDTLHQHICELLNLLEDYNIDISGFQNRWNFITDIETNDIRNEALDEAIILCNEMGKIIQ